MKSKLVESVPPAESLSLVRNASFDKFYGIQNGGNRAILMKVDFASDAYHVVSYHQFTQANSYMYLNNHRTTLIEYIRELNGNGKQVYQFDKLSELAAWIEETEL